MKIAVGNAGDIWEPRMSAASYHLRESSFGIDQIYLGEEVRVRVRLTLTRTLTLTLTLTLTPNP